MFGVDPLDVGRYIFSWPAPIIAAGDIGEAVLCSGEWPFDIPFVGFDDCPYICCTTGPPDTREAATCVNDETDDEEETRPGGCIVIPEIGG